MTTERIHQAKRANARARALGIAAGALSALLYATTAAPCVGFDDAAELAWCATLWSVPHPPGFPIWVALAHAWTHLLGWLDPVHALHLLSAALGGTTVTVLLFACRRLLHALAPGAPAAPRTWAAFFAALSCGLGATFWQWQNAIEVYALQGLATALLLLAVTGDPRAPTARRPFVLAGLAVGLGLANHSLTMLVLAPLALLVARSLWRLPLRDRRILHAAGLAVLVVGAASLLLMWRAAGEHIFEFGNPDTPRRLWHHLSGGFYGGGFFHPEADVGGRLAFFLGLVPQHLWLFAIPAVVGLARLLRTRPAIALVCLGYPAVLMLLQAGRTAVANADSYLIPGFVLLTVPVAVGLEALLAAPRHRLAFAATAAAALLSLLLNWRACDRAGYDAGDALLADLDASAPPRSLLLLTNWDVRILASYHRHQRGWRPDLVVLPSDLKGTNHRATELRQPELFALLQPEYGAWLDAIAAVDPDHVFTDYYQISTRALAEAHAALVAKVIRVAADQGRRVLLDRATLAFFLQGGLLRSEQVHPCGILFAVGKVADAPPFRLGGRWWQHPFLQGDLCAAAVLRDLDRTAEQVLGYLRFHGQGERAATLAPLQQEIRAMAARFAADKPFLGWRRSPH